MPRSVVAALPLLLLTLAHCGGGDSSSVASSTAKTGGTGGAAGSGGGTSGTGGSAGAAGVGVAGSGGEPTGSGGSTGGAGASAGAAGVGVAGSGGGAAGTGGSAGSVGLEIEGSYDLTFTEVVVASSQPFSTSPSKLKNVRLDVRKAGAGYQALFTPAFGAPASYAATLGPSGLSLVGLGDITTSGGEWTSDTWEAISLGVTLSGEFDGTVKGTGQQAAVILDVTHYSDLSGTGTITKDATNPELKASLGSLHGPIGTSFAWDPLVIRASEGLDQAALEKALSVEVGPAGGPPAPPALDVTRVFGPVAGAPTAWGGALSVTLRLTSWDVGTGLLGVSAPPGLLDPTGHATASFSATTPLIGLVKADTHGLDSDVATVHTWGKSVLLGGKSGSDAACEQGGCAKLGPLYVGDCSPNRTGLAGRIATPSKSMLSVRYRVWGKTASAPQAAIGVDVFSRDGLMQGAVSGFWTTLTEAAQPLEGFGFASAWQTLSVPLAVGDESGFVIYTNSDCGGLTPPGYDAIVIIDRIEAQ